MSARVHVYVWHIIEPRKTDEQMPFGAQTRVGLRNHVSDGLHVGATWQILLNLNDTCAAAVWLFVKLL